MDEYNKENREYKLASYRENDLRKRDIKKQKRKRRLGIIKEELRNYIKKVLIFVIIFVAILAFLCSIAFYAIEHGEIF